ncbi:MAG: hypothetical protein AAF700_09270 [Pseudomonadota bacterium]
MISTDTLPPDALLTRYAQRDGCYTDCYSTQIDRSADLTEFVMAFYTTRLFRCERFVLAHMLKRPSNDVEALDFASGKINQFAAWDLEERTGTQLLACDLSHATRSWFMVKQERAGTKLYFGSVVTPKQGKTLGLMMTLALPLHRLYSRLLLSAARNRLNQGQN